jgi:hypothetical protein
VQGNRYSVPAHLRGEIVAIRIGLDGQLRVFDTTGTCVAEHRLTAQQQGWQSIPAYHERLWQAHYQILDTRPTALPERQVCCLQNSSLAVLNFL